ncbi:MAG: DUF4340 domain-containing protein [Verrucomicrobiota bacterium]
MRSFGFTLILALLAVLVCGLAGWQMKEGNFDSVFGAPPTPVGERIYSAYSAVEKKHVPAFSAPEVKYIQLSQNGVNATFELGEKGWQCAMPWKDRMDPRAAVDIINFTLGLRVEDYAEIDEIDAQKAGLKESGVNIRLDDVNHRPLAKYKLGRLTPWLASIKDLDTPVPTVFIQPRDQDHKHYVYSCTGDIASRWFKDGLKYLRDHRPFYFNPLALQKIRILTGQGELTLARETPNSAWRVTKPLDLATDPKAVKSLLEGLYQLEAVKISDRASVTLPASSTLSKSGQIAIVSFGSEVETVLDIFPPETRESREVAATVSDRPDTVFELPLKPAPNLVSLADLPLAVNDLRDAALTNLNIKSLQSILIQPSTGPEILISRTPPQPWMTTIEGQTREANEPRLFSLLKTMQETRVTGFGPDAVTDFSPWGLDRPILKLRFQGEGNQAVELAFGIDPKGEYWVNRTGTPSVMKVDPSLVDTIPRRTYEWRQARLWSIDRVNLRVIGRKAGAAPPLNLIYQFDTAEWTANSDGKDLTATLSPERANYLLDTLEGLKATRWLSPTDESANKALLAPSLVFKIIEETTDDMGDVNGQVTRELFLAPGSAVANPAFYYGRLGSDPQPFLLERDLYQKLATDLLEKE